MTKKLKEDKGIKKAERGTAFASLKSLLFGTGIVLPKPTP